MGPPRSLYPVTLGWILCLLAMFASSSLFPPKDGPARESACSVADPAESTETCAARERMVQEQIIARDVHAADVLAALRKVPRHRFVPADWQPAAYDDCALPIGRGQTISQPYVVAFMTQALELHPQDRVLEIGTGSGYQAAILSLLAREVYSIEIIEGLGKEAEARLKQMGYANVRVRIGDGYRGWPEAAPFDAIIVTAAPPDIPAELVAQLRTGGRLVVPVGRHEQELVRIRLTPKGLEYESLLPVRFVPMVHPAGERAGSAAH